MVRAGPRWPVPLEACASPSPTVRMNQEGWDKNPKTENCRLRTGEWTEVFPGLEFQERPPEKGGERERERVVICQLLRPRNAFNDLLTEQLSLQEICLFPPFGVGGDTSSLA